ncbi:hypothetical protein Tco_1389072 [Tanacetum coccineum]
MFTEARVHRQITAIFKYSFDGPLATWKEVPKRDIQFMWQRFKELYQWDARVRALVENFFKDYLSNRFFDVENLKRQLEERAKAAQERELAAKEQQEAAEEWERAAEERVK